MSDSINITPAEEIRYEIIGYGNTLSNFSTRLEFCQYGISNPTQDDQDFQLPVTHHEDILRMLFREHPQESVWDIYRTKNGLDLFRIKFIALMLDSLIKRGPFALKLFDVCNAVIQLMGHMGLNEGLEAALQMSKDKLIHIYSHSMQSEKGLIYNHVRLSKQITDEYVGEACLLEIEETAPVKKKDEDRKKSVPRKRRKPLPSPKNIYEQLRETVLEQDDACKEIATVAAMALRNMVAIKRGQPNTGNSVILLGGSTGSGKTLLATTLSRVLKCPYTIIDASALTMQGYYGNSIAEEVARGLLAHPLAKEKPEQAMGLVVLDEWDKLCSSDGRLAVSTSGVQAEALKIIEGHDYSITNHYQNRPPERKQCSTNGCIFVLSGAMSPLTDILDSQTKAHIGFDQQCGHHDALDLQEGLRTMGMLPEVIGRLTSIIMLEKLTATALYNILTEKNGGVLHTLNASLMRQGLTIDLDPPAERLLTETARKNGTGVRGLKQILNKAVTDLVFEENTGVVTLCCADIQKAISRVYSVESYAS